MNTKFIGYNYTAIKMVKPIKQTFNVETKNLTIVCGENGTGKSLLLKLTWLTTAFTSMVILRNNSGIEILKNKTDKEILKELFDASFEEQNFEGVFEFRDDLGILKFEMVNGEVTKLELTLKNNLTAGMPIYLSKEVRGFEVIDRYSKIKKLMNLNIQTLEDALKMKDMFKVYDVFALENLLFSFSKVSKLIESINKIDSNLLENLDIVKLENDFGIWYYDSKGKRRSALTLGAGHQAILIMLLTQM